MKKILHIAEPFATGVLSFLIDLTKRQVEDYDVYIIYGIRPLTPDHVESLFDKRVKLIKLDSFKGALGSVINIKAYKDVNKYYKQIQPDIIHLHSSASGFIGRWMLANKNNKVFYTPHGFSFLKEEGFIISKKIFWFIEKISANTNSKIIACSYGEYLEAQKMSSKALYVNNGIDTNGLHPYLNSKSAHLDKNNITICTSGRILEQKNPKLFNEIALLLPHVKFIWIGEGELKNLLTAPNIEVTGWISREKSLEIVSQSDFFILTSFWEGLSISLLEAMFLKKICVVSNVIGNKDVIDNDRNGFICNTAQDFVSCINNIINNKKEVQKIIDAAHQDAVNEYNVEVMASKYSELYNEHS